MNQSPWCPTDRTLFYKTHGDQALDTPLLNKLVSPDKDLDLAITVDTARESWTCTAVGDLKFVYQDNGSQS